MWLPVIKSLPRSAVVLVFPVVVIVGVLAYTRVIDTPVSILPNHCYRYCYPFTSNVDWFNVWAIFNVIICSCLFRKLRFSETETRWGIP